jgi:hypothetical protein
VVTCSVAVSCSNNKMRAVSGLCDLYPCICLTTEQKAWKNLSHCSRRTS